MKTIYISQEIEETGEIYTIGLLDHGSEVNNFTATHISILHTTCRQHADLYAKELSIITHLPIKYI